MKNTLETIKKRRSVRKYSARKIKRSDLLKLVDAGRYAPTARGEQPWEFVVVENGKDLEKIAAITDHGKFIAGAAALIAVFSRESKYYLEDCSAATQNIMLAAAAMKIGSCWVAGDKKPYCKRMRKFLKAPKKYKLASLISLGYPGDKNAFKAIAKRPLKEVCHFGKF